MVIFSLFLLDIKILGIVFRKLGMYMWVVMLLWVVIYDKIGIIVRRILIY